MIISKRKMQKIAEEIGGIIHKNVNIMDEKGVIIASTDLERVGTSHEAAKRVIAENLEHLVVEGAEYAGSKGGINLPLQINNEIVGVVGITGTQEEVGVLGNVIKKMTEILIVEEQRESQKKTKDDIKNNFVIEWLYNENSKNLASAAELLGIRLDAERIIAVSEIDLSAAELSDIEKQEIYEMIAVRMKREIESSKQQFILSVGSKIISFFAVKKQSDVQQKLKVLNADLERRFDCSIYSGIGTMGNDVASVRKSFREAEIACGLSRQIGNRMILYSDTDVRMLLGAIPEKTRKRFVKEVFKDTSEERVEEMVSCLQCYMDNNGSVSATAEELFIHKNTLQYRLTKIKNTTGYDPRIIEESIPLYLAMYIYEFSH